MASHKMNIGLVLCLLMCSVFYGCSKQESDFYIPEKAGAIKEFMGYEIPVFSTAREQLNYARSGFWDPDWKKAALRFVIQQFPDQRQACGNAQLDLAYLNFGLDYRFALELDYRNAVKEYKTILTSYADQPEISVKACWYLGWIYCDLLSQKKTGLPYYWRIVRKYPDIAMGISSPVPWVSLVYDQPQNEKQLDQGREKKYWSALSLLEIIRHADEPKIRKQAFAQLWARYRFNVSTGHAIELLLDDQAGTKWIAPYAKEYLKKGRANAYRMAKISQKAGEN